MKELTKTRRKIRWLFLISFILALAVTGCLRFVLARRFCSIPSCILYFPLGLLTIVWPGFIISNIYGVIAGYVFYIYLYLRGVITCKRSYLYIFIGALLLNIAGCGRIFCIKL